MLWIKALHIVFIASWFAGLFYLPRIFVNLAQIPAEVPADAVRERDRLLGMARRLLRFTTLLAVPALGLGLWLWLWYGIGRGPGQGWMHAKLTGVLLVLSRGDGNQLLGLRLGVAIVAQGGKQLGGFQPLTLVCQRLGLLIAALLGALRRVAVILQGSEQG